MKEIVNKKHIVIDARLYGPKHTGLGRYTKNLLVALSKLPDFKKYKFTLLVYPELESEIKKDLQNNYHYYITSIRHYSISEQILLPVILKSLKPNLVHFTHIDKPILYFDKSVVTVHDLIKLFSKGKETTTKFILFYWIRFFAYSLMVNIILKTSLVIVPSNFWRDYIIKKYNFNPNKIVTTYEAVDPNIKIKNFKLKIKNYILYTGNLYPHKNVNIIFKALQQLPKLKLKIISASNVFQQRARKIVQDLNITNQVEFLGYVHDDKFSEIYQNALALVHPAFLEGFSLTGLEAMAQNCPVIASSNSCLPEIYGDSVLYFNPNNHQELVSQITKLQNNSKLRQDLITKGNLQIKKYSWTKCATETLNFYEQIIG
ncbi:MAG: glycosyltransferase family 1 protein [Candidatus Shapirobacteria bacterium]